MSWPTKEKPGVKQRYGKKYGISRRHESIRKGTGNREEKDGGEKYLVSDRGS